MTFIASSERGTSDCNRLAIDIDVLFWILRRFNLLHVGVPVIEDALAAGRYLDPEYGMVSIYPHQGKGPNCDNYWLFSAQAWSLFYDNSVGETQFWNSCEVRYPGLFDRWPGRRQDISKDEIIGAAYLSNYYARRIASYGSFAWWSFDIQRPGKFTWKYWIGRYPDVAPYIQSRGGSSVWITAKLSWALGCVLSALPPRGSTDGKLLMLLQITEMRKYWVCWLASRFWLWRMRKQYPGGPQELRSIYFPAGHPLVTFSATTWDTI